jgi:hypothetical protein
MLDGPCSGQRKHQLLNTASPFLLMKLASCISTGFLHNGKPVAGVDLSKVKAIPVKVMPTAGNPTPSAQQPASAAPAKAKAAAPGPAKPAAASGDGMHATPWLT